MPEREHEPVPVPVADTGAGRRGKVAVDDVVAAEIG